MLNITIPETKAFDDKTNEFIDIPKTKLQLEHSLISLKKWEEKWHKAFLKKGYKTDEELLDYIRCMTITPNVKPYIYNFIPPKVTKEIVDYIENPMTATVINRKNKEDNLKIRKTDVVTAELFYYYMIELNIPVEFQKWHLNQLITLINVIAVKNGDQKSRKLTGQERIAENARRSAENARRRATLNSRG